MSAAKPMPRVVHVIWFGSEPPGELTRGMDDLRRLNPGWEVRLWREGDVTWMRNHDLLERAPTFAGKANLARYEIVHREGGYYADADFEWLRGFDEEHFPLVRFAIAKVSGAHVNNGFFGAPAGDPFLARVIARVRESFLADPGGPSWQVSGPWFLSAEVDAWVAEGKEVHFIPRDLVYPYSWDRLSSGDGPWAPATVGVHHWSQGRSTRAARRAREIVLDASRRWELRRRGAWARSVLGAGPDARASSAITRWPGLVEGSDAVLDIGSSSAREAVRSTRFLSEFGRTFIFPGDWDPRAIEVEATGPGEAIACEPEDLPRTLDLLSYVAAVHIGPLADSPAVLKALGPAVNEGRIGLVCLDSSTGPAGRTDLVNSLPVSSWVDKGALLRAWGPAGTRLPRSLAPGGRDGVVIDCRPIRRRIVASVDGRSVAWRLSNSGVE